MTLIDVMFSDWVGILSFAVVAGTFIIIAYLSWYFISKSGHHE